MMITNSIIRKFSLFAVLIILSLPITAQDTPTYAIPFLEMLSHVPDVPMAREQLYYADIRTAIETRPGTPQFTSMDEWYDADEEYRNWWINGLPHTLLLMENFRHMLADGGETTGIDFFTIERTLVFGQ
jgi:hypothetical protein